MCRVLSCARPSALTPRSRVVDLYLHTVVVHVLRWLRRAVCVAAADAGERAELVMILVQNVEQYLTPCLTVDLGRLSNTLCERLFMAKLCV